MMRLMMRLTMRRMMRGIVLVGCLLFVGAPGRAAEDPRPNIVLILGDDMGWGDYSFMGHPDIRTPNLDGLAERSLTFGRGYVAAPLCRPSLASIVTGRFPTQHGVTGNDVDGRNDRAVRDIPLRRAFHRHASLIRELTAAGYLTFQSGKWWEGSWQEGGFTAGMTHGDPSRGGRHGDAGLRIGREGLEPITEFVDQALAAQRPFFVWYAPFLPHTPHNPPERFLEHYRTLDRAADVTRYYAMCEWFDETCGTLLGHLERTGAAENTLVVYLCDNGWAAASTNADDPHQKLWKGFAQRSKGSPFELGIRTPILLSWPGRVTPERSDELAHAVDLFPTIAAAAGVRPPGDLPGVNLLSPDARRDRERVFGVVHSIHNVTVGDPNDTLQYLWCVERDWKLIVRFRGRDTTRYRNLHIWDDELVRLYHLRDDPHETRNLANQNPEQVRRLRSEISDWHASQTAAVDSP